ncbi:hypothetical protein J3R04_002625 [Spirilliplanes yamanashiensis]|nr:hypothetical protein [Spirilliplanes yamanashiensis]
MFQKRRCGFTRRNAFDRGSASAPSPVDVIDEQTSSLPTVREPGSAWSSFRSLAQWACTSPVSTTGLRTRAPSQPRVIRSRDAV